MAISPSIPTSFVPKQALPGEPRGFKKQGNNVLMIVSFMLLLLTVGGATGEFFYANYLTKKAEVAAQEILDAQKGVNQDTVNQFITLRNRLDAATSVANNHIALSQFLNLLETATVQNVHFTGIDIKVNDDRTATITVNGQAANFNALEAQASVFAKQQYIKNSIFSDFQLNKDNTVSFSATATLDPVIITEKTPVSQQIVPVFGPVSAKYISPVATSTTATSTLAATTTTKVATSTKP